MGELIGLDRLKERLSYNPETGIFVWRETFSGMCRKGHAAGRMGTGKASGYMRITVDHREYKAHRLAWFYVTGEWPKDQIDHSDGDSSNNRFANLREANQSQNKANSRVYANNTSGIKGVSQRKDNGKWIASIQILGKQKCLGAFENIDDAAKAYQQAAEAAFGRFARPA